MLSSGGCFGPKLQQGDECSASLQCPGNLTCVDGFCCESSAACGGDGDGDGDIDAAPDAPIQAFTDHESPFACDPSTIALFKFDEPSGNFKNACNEALIGTALEAPFVDPAKFGQGVRLNMGESTEKVLYQDQPAMAPIVFTVEAWIRPSAMPAGANNAIVVSSLEVENASTNLGLWALSISASGAVQLELFAPGCKTTLARVETDAGLIGSGAFAHLRAVVDAGSVTLYVNGFLETTKPVSVDRCTTHPDIIIGDLRQVGTTDPYPNYEPFQGHIDELRYSNVPRR